MKYQSVDIVILPSVADTASYPLEIKVPQGPDVQPGTFQLDIPHLTTLEVDPEAYGRELGLAVFNNEIGSAFRQIVAAVEGRGDRVRVRLHVKAPGLELLHWERLYYPHNGEWQPLGISASTPFSRYVTGDQWQQSLAVAESPLRLLAILASSANLQQYHADPITGEERQAFHELLDNLDGIDVTYLESGTSNPPTLAGIRRELVKHYHIVHFLCHGAAFDDGTVLYLEDSEGDVEPVPSETLVEVFQALDTRPSLCFLAACESATYSDNSAFLPLGPALIQDGGLQAVVAMTAQVGIQTAAAFTKQFYERLLAHGTVDLAINEGRALVRDTWDWSVPVLFSRAIDYQLRQSPPSRLQRAIDWVRAHPLYGLLSILSTLLGVGTVLVSVAGAFGVVPIPQPPPPTATSVPPLAGELNIAVADFQVLDTTGNPAKATAAHDLAATMYEAMRSKVSDLNNSQTPIQLDVRQIEGVIGHTADEQAQAVADVAGTINAHIVIYGDLISGTNRIKLVPKFYLPEKLLPDAAELVGWYQFGAPIEVVGDFDDPTIRTDLRVQLQERTEALALATYGLRHLERGAFDKATDYLTAASDLLAAENSAGKELILLFLGTTELRRSMTEDKAASLAQADRYYQDALMITQDQYLRAWLGRGQVQFLLSNGITCEPDEVNAAGLHEALSLYDEAIKRYDSKDPFQVMIPTKAAYFSGKVYECLSRAQAGDYWGDAKLAYTRVITDYQASSRNITYLAAEAHAGLGRIYLSQSAGLQGADLEAKYRAAAEQYTEAIKIEPRQEWKAYYHLFLAFIHVRLQECPAATSELTTAQQTYADAGKTIPVYDSWYQYIAGQEWPKSGCPQPSPSP